MLAFFLKKCHFTFMRLSSPSFLLLSVCCFCLSACNVVRVNKGDTLYSIARRENVSVRSLIERNDIKAPYRIFVGQRLFIPRQRYYTVRKKDTLYSIAKKHDMTVAQLSRLNNIQAPYTLSIGQKLKLTEWDNPPPSTSAKAGVKTQKKTAKATKISKPVSIPKAAQAKRFDKPAAGKIIQGFSSTENAHNEGINIAGKIGDPIKAADAGQVVYAGNELKGYGNLVLVKHKDGWITAYAHNDKLLVKKGAQVARGQKIATMGQTGSVKSPQLHFEVRYKTKVVDPAKYLR